MANKVKAGQMILGQLYKELDTGHVINLHFISVSKAFAIVSTPGELDMQSQWGIPVDREVEEVPRVSYNDKCPACGSAVEPTDNPSNPEVRRWSHWCTNDRCGWMGNIKQ